MEKQIKEEGWRVTQSLLFSLIALRSNNLTLNGGGGRMAVRWGGFWLFNASERQENLYEKM
jgi:hypothetical protein